MQADGTDGHAESYTGVGGVKDFKPKTRCSVTKRDRRG